MSSGVEESTPVLAYHWVALELSTAFKPMSPPRSTTTIVRGSSETKLSVMLSPNLAKTGSELSERIWIWLSDGVIVSMVIELTIPGIEV